MLRVAVFGVIFGVVYCMESHDAIVTSGILAAIAYLATDWLIPRVGNAFIKVGLFGKDLNKIGRPVIPECIGAVSAAIYLLVMFACVPFIFYKDLVVSTAGGGLRDVSKTQDNIQGWHLFPHDKLSEYLSAILCLESTILLGMADDLFDLRWRHKFFLPAIAAIPLLIVYYVDFGVTSIAIPKFLTAYIKKTSIDLGPLYYVYMASMAIFCPNSINILAGVNGLEVGQSIVLGILALANDALFFVMGSTEALEAHRFSAVLIMPFIGVSLALYKWNRWPAHVFVGDTYCYFSGMVFAVVGILGHFSKTMLLLFIPQIINFIYSVPQLFHFVPCPRHRLPRLKEEDGLLYPSRAELFGNKDGQIKVWFVPILKLLHRFKLIELEYDGDNLKSCTNMTMINLTLVWFGPMREDQLCTTILWHQFIVGICAIILRHAGGSVLFGHDNIWAIR